MLLTELFGERKTTKEQQQEEDSPKYSELRSNLFCSTSFSCWSCSPASLRKGQQLTTVLSTNANCTPRSTIPAPQIISQRGRNRPKAEIKNQHKPHSRGDSRVSTTFKTAVATTLPASSVQVSSNRWGILQVRSLRQQHPLISLNMD